MITLHFAILSLETRNQRNKKGQCSQNLDLNPACVKSKASRSSENTKTTERFNLDTLPYPTYRCYSQI